MTTSLTFFNDEHSGISSRGSVPYLAQTRVNLTFPSYHELMSLQVGEHVTSEAFSCGNATFCVKLYPRGGGHGNNNNILSLSSRTSKPGNSNHEGKSKSGFGMAYKQDFSIPFGPNTNVEERVGMYLQSLNKDDQTMDATFALRLKGNQRMGRKFDVEWRAGMRFLPLGKETKLSKGCANDFGAHLMQSSRLAYFMGVDEYEDILSSSANRLHAQVEVIIHDTAKELEAMYQATTKIDSDSDNDEEEGGEDEEFKPTSFFGLLGADIRIPPGKSPTNLAFHDGKRVRVGKIVVPVLSRLSQRPQMFAMGAYPGVEYRILRIIDKNGQERFTSCPGCEYDLKPIYPLVAQLERPWPVTVKENYIPRLYTPNMYNAVSAIGSLLTAITGLTAAFIISQAVSLFFIPSRSMDPTLQVGDVLLVDKVSPRIFHSSQKPGDVVLFSPPAKLKEIVATNGGKLTSRDLFVKRVAAQPGDTVTVDAAGKVQINEQPVLGRRDLCEAEPLRLIEKYIKASKEVTLADDEVFLMGDCSSVSIDSRVWGPLPSSNIVGRPILRLWPPERFGSLPSLPLSTQEDSWND